MIPMTQQAHELLASLVRGTLAIDATAGNGNDTEFLARLVGSKGRVWAFDIQPQALIRTAKRLEERRLSVELHLRSKKETETTELDVLRGDRGSQVICMQASHAEMMRHIPAECRGQIAAIMFNLGYLPGADKSCITLADSTLVALDAAVELLAPQGVLTVVVYPGHPGGDEEADA